MPVTSQQFGRRVQVEIVPPFGDGILVNGNPDAPQLRVKVAVSKSMGGTPSRCTVDITNLGKRDRERAAGVTRRIIDFSDQVGVLDGRVVFGEQFGDGKAEQVTRANGYGYLRVAAYYRGSGITPQTIFDGTSKSVTPTGTKPSPVTRITGGDGVIQEASAITNRQWSSTVTAATVLEYVIRDVMGTSLAGGDSPGGFAAGLPPELQGLELLGGYDATALYATDVVNEFARVTSTEWWWDDGVIYWISKGAALPLAPLVLDVRPSKGSFQIVDTPQAAEDEQVVAPLLLLPQMRPGRLVNILSGDYGGQYVCRSVVHSVDNRGGKARTTARMARFGALPFL